MTLEQLLLAALIGLIAGVLGGLAGVGGSMIMIPGLALIFGYQDEAHTEQHLYMAAAMAVNVLVSAPAAWRHYKNGHMRRELVVKILPGMLAAIVVGVIVSNFIEGTWLRRGLAVFIACYAVFNIYRVLRPVDEATRPPEKIGAARMTAIGGVSGMAGGLLGIGGGVVMVPLLQIFAWVRLRHAIAASSTVMVVSAVIGAALKLGTLGPTHGLSVADAFMFVVAMGPGAVVGGMLGAQLTHVLPLRVVRAAISLLLLLIAARMGGLWG
jgi:uncharacterized membrane protein YfcA